MDVPEAWLVEPVRAEPDLDNLRLADLGAAASLSVEYELEALLLTGSCVDVSARRRDQVCLAQIDLRSGTTWILQRCGPRVCLHHPSPRSELHAACRDIPSTNLAAFEP